VQDSSLRVFRFNGPIHSLACLFAALEIGIESAFANKIERVSEGKIFECGHRRIPRWWWEGG
jgi:hypothetical protein